MASGFGNLSAYVDSIRGQPRDIDRLLRDYADVGRGLLWQRQTMIGGIAALVAFYYDARLAAAALLLVSLAEAIDWVLFNKIARAGALPRKAVNRIIAAFYATTVLSAGSIGMFAVLIAALQGHTTHFMPLFVLFAAALFSAMHNHQIVKILILRLTIYSAAFIFISVRDLWLAAPPLTSELWLQLFLSTFVLFFIFDTARAHARLYREGLGHFESLKIEAERAKVASTAKSEFLSVVNHELRTPLTSIKGALDLIGSGVFGDLPVAMAKPFAIARTNSQRLSALINDVLDFQKIEAGKMEYDFENVNVFDLVSGVIDGIQPLAESRHVSVSAEHLGPSAHVRGDRLRLTQVLNNLMSNAIKFSESGGRVWITTETVSGKVRISVSDEGAGLPPNAERKLFQPFSQVDSSSTRKANGTGLGLSISQKITQAHGGSIDFVRHEDRGTTFFVELDRATALVPDFTQPLALTG